MSLAPGPVQRVWVDRCGVVDRVKDPEAVKVLTERQQAALDWTVERYRNSYDAPLHRHFRAAQQQQIGGANAND